MAGRAQTAGDKQRARGFDFEVDIKDNATYRPATDPWMMTGHTQRQQPRLQVEWVERSRPDRHRPTLVSGGRSVGGWGDEEAVNWSN